MLSSLTKFLAKIVLNLLFFVYVRSSLILIYQYQFIVTDFLTLRIKYFNFYYDFHIQWTM